MSALTTLASNSCSAAHLNSSTTPASSSTSSTTTLSQSAGSSSSSSSSSHLDSSVQSVSTAALTSSSMATSTASTAGSKKRKIASLKNDESQQNPEVDPRLLIAINALQNEVFGQAMPPIVTTENAIKLLGYAKQQIHAFRAKYSECSNSYNAALTANGELAVELERTSSENEHLKQQLMNLNRLHVLNEAMIPQLEIRDQQRQELQGMQRRNCATLTPSHVAVYVNGQHQSQLTPVGTHTHIHIEMSPANHVAPFSPAVSSNGSSAQYSLGSSTAYQQGFAHPQLSVQPQR